MPQFKQSIKSVINPLFFVLIIIINPLIYSSKTVDITFAPQFCFLGIACLLFVILSMTINGVNQFKITFNLINFLIVGYFLMSLLSIILSPLKQEGIIEIYKSGGWILLIFILFQTLQHVDHQQHYLLKSICVIGFVLATIGFFQLARWGFNEIPGNVIPYGTLGNRNIFIPAILILMPFIIYAGMFSDDYRWKYFAIFCVMLITLVIVWSLMRTALLAIGVAMFVNIIIAFFMHSKVNMFFKKYRLAKIILPAIILAFFFVIGLNYFHQLKLKNDKKSALLSFNSTNERTVLWKNTWQMFNDYPLTGVGAGNWKIILPKYGLGGLPPEARKAEMFYIRPENDFLWVFAETGIIGGFCYLGIFVIAAFVCVQKIRKSIHKKERIFAFVVLNALILYGVTAFFGFPKDRTFLQTEFAIIIAFSLLFLEDAKRKSFTIKLPSVVMLICFIFYVFKGTQLLAAELQLSKLIEARKNNQHDLVLTYVESIKDKNYLMDQTSTPIYFYEGVALFSLQKIDEAMLAFHKAESLHPYHLHVLNNLATCYSIKGDFNRSIAYLNKALEISPDFQEAIINLSGLHYNQRNYKEAYKYFFRARTDNKHNQLYVNLDALFTKTINDSLLKLTVKYIEIGDLEKAEASLKACLHKNKMPEYHDMQVAIVRKRQKMNALKNMK